MRVTDASALVPAIVGNTLEARSLRARLDDEALAAPHLVDLEVLNALRRHVRRGRLASADAELAMRRVQRFAIKLYAHGPLLARSWQLRETVTPYDAAYVALAEALGVPLLTADARLANAPSIRCEVELLT